MSTTMVRHVSEDSETAKLTALPDGRYNDGTYDWDKIRDEWTPVSAPYDIGDRPAYARLRKVIVTYETLPAHSAGVSRDLRNDRLTLATCSDCGWRGDRRKHRVFAQVDADNHNA